jgi:serine/threonine-protein kinase
MSMIILQGANELAQGIYYEIDPNLEPLGVGGMGKVYRGVRVQKKSGVRTDAAIKFLFDDLPDHAIERARREASIQIHNDNLIEMFGFIEVVENLGGGKTHTRYHVASELLRGVMLFDLLKGKTTDSNGVEIPFATELYQLYQQDKLRFALRVIKSVLSGILALHDCGYIHRDIDPSNIMVTYDGKIKVIDLGIAKQIETDGKTTFDGRQQLTSVGQFMGKAAYAAPELVVGDVAHEDRTTDLYAIGILFYQLVTGHLPFEGTTMEVLDKQMHEKVPLRDIPSKNVRKVIAKATAKRQSERYASASEFRVAIEQLEGVNLNEPSLSSVVAEKTQMLGDVTKNLSKKPILLWASIAAVILLLAGAGTWWYMNNQNERMEQQRLADEQLRLEQLHLALQDSIIDSYAAETRIVSETHDTLKSVGLLTQEAVSMLLTGDEQSAQTALASLQHLADKHYRSSAEAVYILSRIYYEGNTPDSTLLSMKSKVGELLTPNNQTAYEYDKLAVTLDSTYYKALYEYGCDCLAGELRTGIENSGDEELAKSLFKKTYQYASSAHDEGYVERSKKRLDQLGVDL